MLRGILSTPWKLLSDRDQWVLNAILATMSSEFPTIESDCTPMLCVLIREDNP